MPAVLKASPIACLIMVCAAAAVSACTRATQSDNEASTENAAREPSTNLSAQVPLPQPPMDRAALLHAVAEARSAAAAGADDLQAQRALDGQQFELRIRFGCGGPTDADASALGWTFDRARRVLRIRATPTISTADALVERLKPADAEAAEGFWLPRPWMLHGACPAAKTAGPSQEARSSLSATGKPTSSKLVESPASEKVGIIQFFTESDPRTLRRDRRSYEATRTLEEGAPASGDGFDLVLEGRLRSTAGGRVVLCHAAGPDRPPDCLVSARVDRVRFERPGTGETIAEWGSS